MPSDLVGETGTVQHLRRHVDVNRHAMVQLALPGLCLLTGSGDDPCAHGDDKTRLIGYPKERAGGEEAAVRVFPTKECLDGDRLAGDQGDLGLIVENELGRVQRLTEARFHRHPLDGLPAHRCIKALIPCAALGLGAVHGGVCVAQEVVGQEAWVRARRDADARRREYATFADSKGAPRAFWIRSARTSA